MSNKVFLTDANYKHTLAATRSLGCKGLKVDVGYSSGLPLGAFSKYVNKCVLYPDAKTFPERFVDFLLKIGRRNKYDVIVPIGYFSNLILSRFKDRMQHFVKVPIADYEQLRVAACKDETIALAKELGIPLPRSIMVEKMNSYPANALKYPLVLKSITESGRVCYISSPKQLNEKYLLLHRIGEEPIIVQEYVKGKGYGFFALFNHGKPRAFFMHKRVREYPVTGGASTVAESAYEPELKEYGLKILKALNWHGVAMIEFKKDETDNDFKLIEINPKFWGSLDLAIASGVDFPYLLYRMAMEGDIEPCFNYETGVKFMWPFPDDFKYVLTKPYVFPKFLRDLLNVNVKKNVKFSDLKPNFAQLLETAALSLNGLRTYREFRYPHGKPSRDAK